MKKATLLLCLLITVLVPRFASATIVGPYTSDANTLFLFHFNESAGGSVTANAGSKGGNAYTVTNTTSGNGLAVPPTVTTMLARTSYSGFGNCVALTNTAAPYTNGLVGFDANNSGAFQADVQGGPTSPDVITLTNLNIGFGGQTPFTLEAMICPTATNFNQEIICTDDYNGTRGFQWKITAGQINFNAIGATPNLLAPIPSSGFNAFVPNTWYHVAVTYDGTTVKLYWTKVDPSVTTANLIGSAAGAIGTAFGAAQTPLIIGNENRGSSQEGFEGLIDEVRISSVARAANAMLFANGVTVTANPNTAVVSAGGTATFTVAATTDFPNLTYQWLTNGVAIVNGGNFSGATTSTLQVANVNTTYASWSYSCTVSDSRPSPGPDSATSTSASIIIHTPLNLAWLASPADFNWNSTSIDWKNLATIGSTAFTIGDNVIFDDSGNVSSPVSVNGALSPSSVTFSNASETYTIVAAAAGGSISGGTGLTQSGAGTVNLYSPTNSYAGITTLNGGILNVTNLAIGGSPSPIGAASSASANLVLNGGELQYSGLNASIDRGATLGANGGTLAVATAGNTLTLGGVIAGTSGGALTTAGNGTLNLSNTNSYNGNTTISAGTVQLSGNGTFGTGNVTNNSAILTSGNITVTNNISGTGIVTNDGTGTLTLSGNNSYSGVTTIYGPSTGGLVVASNGALSPNTTVNVISTTGGAYGGTRVTLNAGVATPAGTTLVLPTSSTVRSTLASAGASSWNGPITINGDGSSSDQLAFLGNSNLLTINGNVTGSSFAGTLQLRNPSGSGVINGTLNLGASATLQVHDGTTWTIGSTGNTWNLSQIALGTLKVGANNALPTNTTVNFGAVGNGTLDLNGYNQQVAGLVIAGNIDTITNSSATADSVLTFAGGTSTFSGVMSDGAHKLSLAVVSGSLTLSGANTYSGNTVISNATLILGTGGSISSTNIINVASGATFDVSALGSYSLNSGQNLEGSGGVNGSVATASGSAVYPGTDGTIGTLAFNSGLTLVTASTVNFDLSTAYNGANDQITVSGALTLNGNAFHIKAPSTLANLDSTADYVLITAGSIAGSFSSTPVWDVRPANAANFTIVTDPGLDQVRLHYSTLTPPTGSGLASPSTAVHNQNVFISVTVTNGSGTVDPNTGVVLDASSIGGSSSVYLVLSGTPNVYTNTVNIQSSTAAASYVLTATITDSNSQIGTANISLNVTTTETWNGASGTDQNWDTSLNWVSGVAPDLTGDSLIFAGSVGPTPNMDNSYSVAGLTFSNNATGFNIGTANSSTLTLAGGVTNNSAAAQTLNVPITLGTTQTFNAAAGNLIVSGVIGDNGNGYGLTVAGTKTLTLSGTNTYAGQTIVSAGTLNIAATGTVTNSTNTIVGSVSGNAALDVSGSLSAYYLLIGNSSGAVGAVNQTGGTVSATLTSGYDNLSIGNIAGSYGYYDASGGVATINGICVGGEDNNGTAAAFGGTGGNGVMDITGGAVNDTGWFVMARNTPASAQTGVLNVFSGLLAYAGGGVVNNWGGGQTAIVNIMGGAVTNTLATVGFNLNQSGNSGNKAVLNLNGGIAQGNAVSGTAARVNFNGGTLQASAANTSFMTGLGSAYIYSGGATINNNGFAITIAQPLLAPTGNGVNGIASFTGGAGYIAPPIVTVTNGVGDTTGVGATAIAQINPLTGVVANIVITSPGVNYTATPTFILSGGGATTPATITGAVPTANTSGGLTTTGSGILTLSGANTYTGNTTVNGGTLVLNQATLATNSTVTVASGAVLQLGFSVTNRVASLVLNGVSQAPGVYNSTTGSPYITGSGSLLVPAAGPSGPAYLTNSVSGGHLNLSWPAGQSWRLEMQTNSVATGLSTNWTDVTPGTASSTNIPINVSQPTVFYRLIYP